MSPDILTTYNRRCKQAQDRLDFKVSVETILHGTFANIVKVRKHYGLSVSGNIVLLPVFDEIQFSEEGSLAYCRIGDLWTLYVSTTGEEVMSQSIGRIPTYNSGHRTLELVANDGRKGLYDTVTRRLVLEAIYDEVSPCASYSHVWVRKGNQWGFVDRTTREETLLYGMTRAFEADGGLFLRENDRIVCIDSTGNADMRTLRLFVLHHHGRGSVHNDKYNETLYFDIYGNILR